MIAPLTIAAIDAGSNAIRISIGSATSPTEWEPIFAERVPVRLGHNAFTRRELDAATVEEAIGAFARFRGLFNEHGVSHYRAVATSALRNAKNRDSLLHRLYHDTGIELEVIDGLEEARLVRRAVMHAFRDRAKPELIVDLGGGSLEITVRDDAAWETGSMRIGTVRLIETFGLTDSISVDEARLIRRYVASLISSNLQDDVDRNPLTAACGGNAEALASLFGERDEGGMLTLSAEKLEAALPKLLKSDIEKRMTKHGVRRDRAEVMPVAGLIFAQLFEELHIDRFVVPGVGIREGLLLDLAETHLRDVAPSGVPRELAVLASGRSFAGRMGHDITHGEQVRRIAVSLFDQLKDVHGLGEACRFPLEVAALLHDLGEVVHRRGHHKHGAYLVLNGRIPGLASPEREMVAALIRAHRKSLPDPKKHLTYATLEPEQQNQVRRLIPLLRLADGIDTDHRQRVVEVRPEISSNKILFHIAVEQAAGETQQLAQRKAVAFTEEYGYATEFDVTVVPPMHRHHAAVTE